jgi:phosphoglycerate dehydrogenase-like enzyme
MTRPHVLVGISMHHDALATLQEFADVDCMPWDDMRIPQTIASYDGAVVYTPPASLMEALDQPRLKVVACHSAAPDIASALAQYGIQVTLTPGLWEGVAEMTVALLLAAARNLPQVHSAIEQGQWGPVDLKSRYSGLSLGGKTLGIIGLGRIGRLLARQLQGFRLHLLYHDAVRRTEWEGEWGLEYVALDDLLTQSDFVVILAALNEHTRGMLGEAQLRCMKRDAILVNTARGAIVQPDALYAALHERWIRGAALDVYVDEPLKPGHPLLGLDNVVLSPHLGGSTQDIDMAMVNDVIRVLSDQPPLNPYT